MRSRKKLSVRVRLWLGKSIAPGVQIWIAHRRVSRPVRRASSVAWQTRERSRRLFAGEKMQFPALFSSHAATKSDNGSVNGMPNATVARMKMPTRRTIVTYFYCAYRMRIVY